MMVDGLWCVVMMTANISNIGAFGLFWVCYQLKMLVLFIFISIELFLSVVGLLHASSLPHMPFDGIL